MADMFTKDLKAGRINVNDAKLPFQNDGDRIARYGKGFSNLLHMAGAPQESTNINTH